MSGITWWHRTCLIAPVWHAHESAPSKRNAKSPPSYRNWRTFPANTAKRCRDGRRFKIHLGTGRKSAGSWRRSYLTLARVGSTRTSLESLRRDHREWRVLRMSHLNELRALFSERRDEITAKAEELVEVFAELVELLLVEEARLVQVQVNPRYVEAPGVGGDRVEVPAYAAEIASAARPALTRRNEPSEVSESQRELIDLAFRLGPCGGIRGDEHIRDGDTRGKSGRYLDGTCSQGSCGFCV